MTRIFGRTVAPPTIRFAQDEAADEHRTEVQGNDLARFTTYLDNTGQGTDWTSPTGGHGVYLAARAMAEGKHQLGSTGNWYGGNESGYNFLVAGPDGSVTRHNSRLGVRERADGDRRLAHLDQVFPGLKIDLTDLTHGATTTDLVDHMGRHGLAEQEAIIKAHQAAKNDGRLVGKLDFHPGVHGFVKAIHENPGDDAPYLMLSDYLNDPENSGLAYPYHSDDVKQFLMNARGQATYWPNIPHYAKRTAGYLVDHLMKTPEQIAKDHAFLDAPDSYDKEHHPWGYWTRNRQFSLESERRVFGRTVRLSQHREVPPGKAAHIEIVGRLADGRHESELPREVNVHVEPNDMDDWRKNVAHYRRWGAGTSYLKALGADGIVLGGTRTPTYERESLPPGHAGHFMVADPQGNVTLHESYRPQYVGWYDAATQGLADLWGATAPSRYRARMARAHEKAVAEGNIYARIHAVPGLDGMLKSLQDPEKINDRGQYQVLTDFLQDHGVTDPDTLNGVWNAHSPGEVLRHIAADPEDRAFDPPASGEKRFSLGGSRRILGRTVRLSQDDDVIQGQPVPALASHPLDVSDEANRLKDEEIQKPWTPPPGGHYDPQKHGNLEGYGYLFPQGGESLRPSDFLEGHRPTPIHPEDREMLDTTPHLADLLSKHHPVVKDRLTPNLFLQDVAHDYHRKGPLWEIARESKVYPHVADQLRQWAEQDKPTPPYKMYAFLKGHLADKEKSKSLPLPGGEETIKKLRGSDTRMDARTIRLAVAKSKMPYPPHAGRDYGHELISLTDPKTGKVLLPAEVVHYKDDGDKHTLYVRPFYSWNAETGSVTGNDALRYGHHRQAYDQGYIGEDYSGPADEGIQYSWKHGRSDSANMRRHGASSPALREPDEDLVREAWVEAALPEAMNQFPGDLALQGHAYVGSVMPQHIAGQTPPVPGKAVVRELLKDTHDRLKPDDRTIRGQEFAEAGRKVVDEVFPAHQHTWRAFEKFAKEHDLEDYLQGGLHYLAKLEGRDDNIAAPYKFGRDRFERIPESLPWAVRALRAGHVQARNPDIEEWAYGPDTMVGRRHAYHAVREAARLQDAYRDAPPLVKDLGELNKPGDYTFDFGEKGTAGASEEDYEKFFPRWAMRRIKDATPEEQAATENWLEKHDLDIGYGSMSKKLDFTNTFYLWRLAQMLRRLDDAIGDSSSKLSMAATSTAATTSTTATSLTLTRRILGRTVENPAPGITSLSQSGDTTRPSLTSQPCRLAWGNMDQQEELPLYHPKPRPSDTTETEWLKVRHFFPERFVFAHNRQTPVRVLLNATLFRLENKIPLRKVWEYAPDLPPWGSLHSWESHVKNQGLWPRIVTDMGRAHLLPVLDKMLRLTKRKGAIPKARVHRKFFLGRRRYSLVSPEVAVTEKRIFGRTIRLSEARKPHPLDVESHEAPIGWEHNGVILHQGDDPPLPYGEEKHNRDWIRESSLPRALQVFGTGEWQGSAQVSSAGNRAIARYFTVDPHGYVVVHSSGALPGQQGAMTHAEQADDLIGPDGRRNTGPLYWNRLAGLATGRPGLDYFKVDKDNPGLLAYSIPEEMRQAHEEAVAQGRHYGRHRLLGRDSAGVARSVLNEAHAASRKEPHDPATQLILHDAFLDDGSPYPHLEDLLTGPPYKKGSWIETTHAGLRRHVGEEGITSRAARDVTPEDYREAGVPVTYSPYQLTNWLLGIRRFSLPEKTARVLGRTVRLAQEGSDVLDTHDLVGNRVFHADEHESHGDESARYDQPALRAYDQARLSGRAEPVAVTSLLPTGSGYETAILVASPDGTITAHRGRHPSYLSPYKAAEHVLPGSGHGVESDIVVRRRDPKVAQGYGVLADAHREAIRQGNIYGRATAKPTDQIPGGKSDDVPESDVSSSDLAKGQKVEREHTSSPAIAREIAKDHLVESPTKVEGYGYYDLLDMMELALGDLAGAVKAGNKKQIATITDALDRLRSELRKAPKTSLSLARKRVLGRTIQMSVEDEAAHLDQEDDDRESLAEYEVHERAADGLNWSDENGEGLLGRNSSLARAHRALAKAISSNDDVHDINRPRHGDGPWHIYATPDGYATIHNPFTLDDYIRDHPEAAGLPLGERVAESHHDAAKNGRYAIKFKLRDDNNLRFLQSVLENHDRPSEKMDDAPGLVWADYLDDQGYPEHAHELRELFGLYAPAIPNRMRRLSPYMYVEQIFDSLSQKPHQLWRYFTRGPRQMSLTEERRVFGRTIRLSHEDEAPIKFKPVGRFVNPHEPMSREELAEWDPQLEEDYDPKEHEAFEGHEWVTDPYHRDQLERQAATTAAMAQLASEARRSTYTGQTRAVPEDRLDAGATWYYGPTTHLFADTAGTVTAHHRENPLGLGYHHSDQDLDWRMNLSPHSPPFQHIAHNRDAHNRAGDTNRHFGTLDMESFEKHRPFLEAIRDADKDDAPALVYADWLDDEGHSGPAEAIRLEKALGENSGLQGLLGWLTQKPSVLEVTVLPELRERLIDRREREARRNRNIQDRLSLACAPKGTVRLSERNEPPLDLDYKGLDVDGNETSEADAYGANNDGVAAWAWSQKNDGKFGAQGHSWRGVVAAGPDGYVTYHPPEHKSAYKVEDLEAAHRDAVAKGNYLFRISGESGTLGLAADALREAQNVASAIDPGPELILADYLEEQGYPHHARHLRIRHQPSKTSGRPFGPSSHVYLVDILSSSPEDVRKRTEERLSRMSLTGREGRVLGRTIRLAQPREVTDPLVFVKHPGYVHLPPELEEHRGRLGVSVHDRRRDVHDILKKALLRGRAYEGHHRLYSNMDTRLDHPGIPFSNDIYLIADSDGNVTAHHAHTFADADEPYPSTRWTLRNTSGFGAGDATLARELGDNAEHPEAMNILDAAHDKAVKEGKLFAKADYSREGAPGMLKSALEGAETAYHWPRTEYDTTPERIAGDWLEDPHGYALAGKALRERPSKVQKELESDTAFAGQTLPDIFDLTVRHERTPEQEETKRLCEEDIDARRYNAQIEEGAGLGQYRIPPNPRRIGWRLSFRRKRRVLGRTVAE